MKKEESVVNEIKTDERVVETNKENESLNVKPNECAVVAEILLRVVSNSIVQDDEIKANVENVNEEAIKIEVENTKNEERFETKSPESEILVDQHEETVISSKSDAFELK